MCRDVSKAVWPLMYAWLTCVYVIPADALYSFPHDYFCSSFQTPFPPPSLHHLPPSYHCSHFLYSLSSSPYISGLLYSLVSSSLARLWALFLVSSCPAAGGRAAAAAVWGMVVISSQPCRSLTASSKLTQSAPHPPPCSTPPHPPWLQARGRGNLSPFPGPPLPLPLTMLRSRARACSI